MTSECQERVFHSTALCLPDAVRPRQRDFYEISEYSPRLQNMIGLGLRRKAAVRWLIMWLSIEPSAWNITSKKSQGSLTSCGFFGDCISSQLGGVAFEIRTRRNNPCHARNFAVAKCIILVTTTNVLRFPPSALKCSGEHDRGKW